MIHPILTSRIRDQLDQLPSGVIPIIGWEVVPLTVLSVCLVWGLMLVLSRRR